MAEFISEREMRKIHRDRVRDETDRQRELMERLKLDRLLPDRDDRIRITSTPMVGNRKKVDFEDEHKELLTTIDQLGEVDESTKEVLGWIDSKVKEYDIKSDRISSKIDTFSYAEESRLKEEIEKLELKERKLGDEIERSRKDVERERRLESLRQREESLRESVRQKEASMSMLRDSYDTDGNVRSFMHKPSVPVLTEETYDEWKAEVEFMIKSGLYHDELMRQAVRNSLTGRTRKVLLSVNPSATTIEIVEKLDSIFGNVKSGEAILAEFYSTKQRQGESVAEWGIRLENMLGAAMRTGLIKDDTYDGLLRNRFWRNLYSEKLRIATRWCYDTAVDFEDLRMKVRREENEMLCNTGSHQSSVLQQNVDQENAKLMKEVLGRLKSLEQKLERIEKQNRNNSDSSNSESKQGGSSNWKGKWNRNGQSSDKKEEQRKDLNQ